MERSQKKEALLTELAADMAVETGIEPELCTISAAWVYDMAAQVLANPPRRLDAKYFSELQQQTGEAFVVLPRDADDIPLFRTRYVARELFYKLIAHKYPDARAQIEGSPLEITVHYDRLHEVTQTLLTLQRDQQYPYDTVKAEVPNRSENMPPEDILPRGSEQHAQFLWHVCYWMGGGIESNNAFKYLAQMYTDYPELFDPRYIVGNEVTEEQIAEVVSQYSALNFNLERIKNYWITNAHRMVSDYGGDVRKVFDGAKSYRTIKYRLVNEKGRGFKGFQEKMASMYTHFLADADIIEEIPFPPPVDFHILRLTSSLGVLTFKNMGKNGIYEKKTIATLRKAFYDYIITTGASEIELDDAWWRYSKLMCSVAPSNAAEVDFTAARGEKSTAKQVDFANPTILAKYARSCGRCALSASCTSSITSGAYYADDRIHPQPRMRPEDETAALVSFTNSMLSLPTEGAPSAYTGLQRTPYPPAERLF